MEKYFTIKVLDLEVYYDYRRNGSFDDNVYLAVFFTNEKEAENELALITDQDSLLVIQPVYISKQLFEQIIEQQKMLNQ